MQVESHDPAGHAVDTGDAACEAEVVAADSVVVGHLPELCPLLMSAAGEGAFLHSSTDCARFVFAQLVAGVVQAEALFSESRAGQWVEPWAQGRQTDVPAHGQLVVAVASLAEQQVALEAVVVERVAIQF